jgi:hypothetical protein
MLRPASKHGDECAMRDSGVANAIVLNCDIATANLHCLLVQCSESCWHWTMFLFALSEE